MSLPASRSIYWLIYPNKVCKAKSCDINQDMSVPSKRLKRCCFNATSILGHLGTYCIFWREKEKLAKERNMGICLESGGVG